jgi:hypothetical protein
VMVGVMIAAGTGCTDDSVRLTYRPSAGDRSSYEIRVRSRSVVRLPGQPTRSERHSAVLRAEQEVLGIDAEGIRVRIRLRPSDAPDSETRTFVVELDRAAQLSEVQEVEGLPAAVLGDLGLAEIFPAAAGAAPDRRLRPGERWRIDEVVELPGASASPLRGRGRLAELGVIGGRKVATVETTTRLAVNRTTGHGLATTTLVGEQSTTSSTAHDITDGSVQEARSVTAGRYVLTIAPPADLGVGPPVEGTLEVEVRSTTRRLD